MRFLSKQPMSASSLSAQQPFSAENVVRTSRGFPGSWDFAGAGTAFRDGPMRASAPTFFAGRRIVTGGNPRKGSHQCAHWFAMASSILPHRKNDTERYPKAERYQTSLRTHWLSALPTTHCPPGLLGRKGTVLRLLCRYRAVPKGLAIPDHPCTHCPPGLPGRKGTVL